MTDRTDGTQRAGMPFGAEHATESLGSIEQRAFAGAQRDSTRTGAAEIQPFGADRSADGDDHLARPDLRKAATGQ